ncbi:MAG: hypothetical protein ABI769_06325 [Pseudomonadota bacterium]
MSSRHVCTLLLALIAGPVAAQVDQILPPIGGPGGGQFFQRCREDSILTGVALLVGDDVDGIRAYCRISPEPTGGQSYVYNGSAGSPGGKWARLECPDSAPLVTGIEVGYEGEQTVIVNNVHLFCGLALPNQSLTTYPTAVFDGPPIGKGGDGLKVALSKGFASCPPGLVAVGINGRAGKWVDAFSLICGPLFKNPNYQHATPEKPVVKSIGRVNTGTSTPRPPRPICDSARDALARQSPASPNLVAQCRAAGGNPGAGPSNKEIEAVRMRGEYACSIDAAASELRNRFTGFARRGFEIGLGAWADQTAPGPGKQRYHDALTAPEQQGFDLAAAYALPKNLYAKLIAVGLVIAGADAEVAAARTTDADVFFRQGFDIASGLFGDPAAGSEGSKVMGAGAMAIRNGLSEPGRRGFDASAKLHLARSY